MKDNTPSRYEVDDHGLIYSDLNGDIKENFTGTVTLPAVFPSKQFFMCVTDYNLIVPYIVLSLANRLSKRFNSCEYRVRNYKRVVSNQVMGYEVLYITVINKVHNTEITIKFNVNNILVAEFYGEEVAKDL